MTEKNQSSAVYDITRDLIPMPASIQAGQFLSSLSPATQIQFDESDANLAFIAKYLDENLISLVGVPSEKDLTTVQNIHLALNRTSTKILDEAYSLKIDETTITLTAPSPAGLFMGVQTLLQLPRPFPRNRHPIVLPQCKIYDIPRFEWRGVMLDVARHYFSVSDVKRVIDLISRYKFNHLHLHLTDDQGWRIEIKSWPKLAEIGGSTQVGGDLGGFYTQEDYTEIVSYALDRHIIIVPEIDMPGHTNAALASYPELNPDGKPPELYTGIEVGFSSLSIDKEITYQFISDVLREIAALTPGPYLHIGGDEAKSTKQADYKAFIEQIQNITASLGKQMIGWQEISQAQLIPGSIVQYWTDEADLGQIQEGVKVIMSPARRAYLDMKYHPDFDLGLNWAGYLNVQDAFEWDPVNYLESIPFQNILGLEAPLWSETLETIDEIEYMLFPRLLCYSEIGWSRNASQDFQEFGKRIGNHGPRLDTLDLNYYRSELINWDNDKRAGNASIPRRRQDLRLRF